jgi:taurine dioxygenase
MADLSDDAVRKDLYDLWIDKGLIVFRGLSGAADQVALSKCFGECQGHPVKPQDAPREHPELVNVRYNPDDADVYEVDGREIGAWLPWHFDLVYVDKVNHGGILRPIIAPSIGGETGFLDKIALYDSLPRPLKDQIEGLSVVYRLDLDVEHQKFGRRDSVRLISHSRNISEIISRQPSFPRVIHPLVFTQLETGRKVLNFSPWFALGVHGMEDEAGDALLHQVAAHCVDEGQAYFHSWKDDDMVLWDNWRMLHCAAGIPAQSSRWLQRTTIAGDYNLGRAERISSVERDTVNI